MTLAYEVTEYVPKARGTTDIIYRQYEVIIMTIECVAQGHYEVAPEGNTIVPYKRVMVTVPACHSSWHLCFT